MVVDTEIDPVRILLQSGAQQIGAGNIHRHDQPGLKLRHDNAPVDVAELLRQRIGAFHRSPLADVGQGMVEAIGRTDGVPHPGTCGRG